MQIIEYPQKELWPTLLNRPGMQSENLESSARKILDEVKNRGDNALLEYSVLFDQTFNIDLIVRDEEFDSAAEMLDAELKTAILQAKKNISKFHENQQIHESEVEIMPGIHCWRKSVPIEKIGLYIPGGTAPLFSTLLML
ncbi:MAG TPA: histidinol dehydrogenase, partial [Puia sp.]|nr:histidinol dehydrogenase [Puia sp.]